MLQSPPTEKMGPERCFHRGHPSPSRGTCLAGPSSFFRCGPAAMAGDVSSFSDIFSGDFMGMKISWWFPDFIMIDDQWWFVSMVCECVFVFGSMIVDEQWWSMVVNGGKGWTFTEQPHICIYLMEQLNWFPYVSAQDLPSNQSVVCWFLKPTSDGSLHHKP